MDTANLKSYSAVFVVNGGVRRAYFEAADEEEARKTCALWGAGLEAEAMRPAAPTTPLPEAYDAERTTTVIPPH